MLLIFFECAIPAFRPVGVQVAEMDFTKLMRQHGFKIEECSLVLGAILGQSSIKSAAQTNSAVVIFVDSMEKAKCNLKV